MRKHFYKFDPDGLDRVIQEYIRQNPGTNVKDIWRHVKRDDGLTYNELTIRHRIKTLEKAGYVWTVKDGKERLCYIDAPVEF